MRGNMILKLISVFGELITIDTDCIVSLTLWHDEWTKIEWFKNGELSTKIVRESPQEIFRLIKNKNEE